MTNPNEFCATCGGGFFAGTRVVGLCCCAEGAKLNRGAELRYKETIRQCYQTGCTAKADVDGWCDDHSHQFKTYGTHCCVGPTGSNGP
jgi:hypothetical protein